MKALVAIGLVFTLAGCATMGQTDLRDFNKDFNQNIPTDPQYKVESVGTKRYQVVVYQGSALLSERTTRVSFLRKAGLLAMDDQCVKKDKSSVREFDFNDNVDSMGYMNVIGVFSCN